MLDKHIPFNTCVFLILSSENIGKRDALPCTREILSLFALHQDPLSLMKQSDPSWLLPIFDDLFGLSRVHLSDYMEQIEHLKSIARILVDC